MNERTNEWPFLDEICEGGSYSSVSGPHLEFRIWLFNSQLTVSFCWYVDENIRFMVILLDFDQS